MIRRLLPICFLALIGLLLCSCQPLSAALYPTQTAFLANTSAATQTPYPTYTLYPSSTPYPTYTLLPTLMLKATTRPTATPHPTFTATPVPTATAVLTDTALLALTLLQWSQETRLQLDIIGDASQMMGELFEIAMLGDANWTALLTAQVVKLREADAVLRGMVPPEECREAHEVLLSASADGLLASEYSLEWTQEQDPALVEQAGEYTRSMVAKMNLYRLLVKAMTP